MTQLEKYMSIIDKDLIEQEKIVKAKAKSWKTSSW